MKALIAALPLAVVFPLSSFAQSAALPALPDDRSAFEDRHPAGLFSTIVTAHGQEMVMGPARSFEIVPIKPSETFSSNVPEIFVVFNLHQHDGEFKVYGRWIVEKGEGVSPNHELGTDAMILAIEDDSGYVSLKQPPGGWPVGDYKVKIFIGTGSADMNPIGALRFRVLPVKTAS
jgi:hypothetical protein